MEPKPPADSGPLGEPARPLRGYRDVGEDVEHGRAAHIRAWLILALMVVVSLAWTLTVYFVEPGLR